MYYNVIDIDPAMDYDIGEEVIASVEANSPAEAIAKVLEAAGIDVLKAYDPDAYAFHILKYVQAKVAHRKDCALIHLGGPCRGPLRR